MQIESISINTPTELLHSSYISDETKESLQKIALGTPNVNEIEFDDLVQSVPLTQTLREGLCTAYVDYLNTTSPAWKKRKEILHRYPGNLLIHITA